MIFAYGKNIFSAKPLAEKILNNSFPQPMLCSEKTYIEHIADGKPLIIKTYDSLPEAKIKNKLSQWCTTTHRPCFEGPINNNVRFHYQTETNDLIFILNDKSVTYPCCDHERS